jgi:hypothetical protein
MTTRTPQLSPQEMADLSKLMWAISHDPKTRAATARIVAAIDPQTARTAFHDVVQDEKLARVLKTIEDDKLKDKMERITEGREHQKREVIRKRGLNADAVKAIENLRTQYGFSDWEAAADIYATRNPPTDPSLDPPPEITGSTFDFPTVPGRDGKMLDFKDYIQNPRKHSNDMAYQMIRDFKLKRLPHAFHAS